MRVAVVGATGNVGTSVLHALAAEDRVESIVGIARRRPALEWPKTTWVEADISQDDSALAVLSSAPRLRSSNSSARWQRQAYNG